MFDLHDLAALPPYLKEHAVTLEIAAEVGSSFGFQQSNVYGQSEHLILLLASTRGNAVEILHRDLFSNYVKWCRHLVSGLLIDSIDSLDGEWAPSAVVDLNPYINPTRFFPFARLVPNHQNLIPVVSSPEEQTGHSISLPPGPNGPNGPSPSDGQQILYEQMILLLLIWGEAGNCRHCPEYILFLFHFMYREYRMDAQTTPSDKRLDKRPADFFLQKVITPVFTLLRKYMRASKGDHKEKKNYDDFNEMFWSPQCLDYTYFNDDECSDPQTRRQSIADAYSRGPKTYREKRSWFHALSTFRRIIEWHFLTFHLLTCIAYGQADGWSTDEQVHVMLSTVLSIHSYTIHYRCTSCLVQCSRWWRSRSSANC
jgi:callose synthase